MTLAGANIRCTIIAINYADDDDVGGAVITGTVAHTNVIGRIESNEDEQLLLQQGLETVRTFNALLVPPTITVRERDELEITAPGHHPYYGVRFRIMGVQYPSTDLRNPNSYIRLSMVRSVRSHGNQ
jgi:hypothetical protein